MSIRPSSNGRRLVGQMCPNFYCHLLDGHLPGKCRQRKRVAVCNIQLAKPSWGQQLKLATYTKYFAAFMEIVLSSGSGLFSRIMPAANCTHCLGMVWGTSRRVQGVALASKFQSNLFGERVPLLKCTLYTNDTYQTCNILYGQKYRPLRQQGQIHPL